MNRIERIEYSRTELVAQPEAIERALSITDAGADRIISALRARGIRRIYLTGSGDCYIVSEAVAPLWQRWLRLPCIPFQVLEYARYGLDCTDASTLVVVITGSTGYPALFEGLREAGRRGAFTLGITNHENTPVSTETTDHLLIPATRIGWPTQISTAQIASLLRLGLAWAGLERTHEAEVLSSLPAIVRKVIDAQDAQTRELAERQRDQTMFFFAGSGPAYAAGRMGAAKIKEMSQDHALTMYLEEYHHYYPIKKSEVIFLLAPEGVTHDRAVDTARDAAAEQADLIILLQEGDRAFDELPGQKIALPKVPESLSSIVYAIPLHLFSQHLAILKQKPEWAKQDNQGRRVRVVSPPTLK